MVPRRLDTKINDRGETAKPQSCELWVLWMSGEENPLRSPATPDPLFKALRSCEVLPVERIL